MSGERIAVLGVGQTKYRSTRGDVSIAGLVREAAYRALEDAQLGWGDIDAVVIGTWPYLHCPITLAALEAGKHVACEKPLSNTLDSARQMAEAAEKKQHISAQIKNPKQIILPNIIECPT